MVKKSSNSSNKGKNNNIGKMFIKRENNNTWIMLGLVLVLCVVVYYYVTSKNNDRTEEQFSDLLCKSSSTHINNKKLQLILDIMKVKLKTFVELKGKDSLLNSDGNLKPSDYNTYLKQTHEKLAIFLTDKNIPPHLTNIRNYEDLIKDLLNNDSKYKDINIYDVKDRLKSFKNECNNLKNPVYNCSDVSKYKKLCDTMDDELTKVKCQMDYTSSKNTYNKDILLLKISLLLIHKDYLSTDDTSIEKVKNEFKEDLENYKKLTGFNNDLNSLLKTIINSINNFSVSFPENIKADLKGVRQTLEINQSCLDNKLDCLDCDNMVENIDKLFDIFKNDNDTIVKKVIESNMFPEWKNLFDLSPSTTQAPTQTQAPATTQAQAPATTKAQQNPTTTQAQQNPTTTKAQQNPTTTQTEATKTTQAQAPATTQAQSTTTTQAEATTTTQAQSTTTTQAQSPASNNANELSTETQELYQRVRNEIAQLYNSASGELSDFLKEGLKSLTPSQRKSLCNCYCTSFTPCTELCKLTECANCTGDAIGDTDMSSMGLPNTTLGYAGIDDQYVLLDNIDDNTAGLNVNANLENLGNKHLVGPHIVQKDTNGISNIFAPYIIMTPKRKNETYGTYLLEDPNDPFQKRFVESVLANY